MVKITIKLLNNDVIFLNMQLNFLDVSSLSQKKCISYFE